MLRIRDAGNVLRTARFVRIRDAGNVLRLARQIRVRDAGNVLRTVYQGVTIALTARSVTRAQRQVTVTSTYTLANDGTVLSNAAVVETWCSDASFVGDYEAQATLLSGTLASGTLNAWLNLGTSRAWSAQDTVEDGAAVSGTIRVQIRRVGTVTVLATADILITADRLPPIDG